MKGKDMNPLDRATQEDVDTASTEELEAAETLLDRGLAGCCQNCGKKEGCTCNFIG